MHRSGSQQKVHTGLCMEVVYRRFNGTSEAHTDSPRGYSTLLKRLHTSSQQIYRGRPLIFATPVCASLRKTERNQWASGRVSARRCEAAHRKNRGSAKTRTACLRRCARLNMAGGASLRVHTRCSAAAYKKKKKTSSRTCLHFCARLNVAHAQ